MKIPKDIKDIAKVCADCGNCLSVCPVYNAEFIEPNSPRGKVNIIKGLIDGTLENSGKGKKYIYQCLLCGSCEDICTKGVEYVDMMISYRGYISQNKNIPLIKKIILSFYGSYIYKKLLFMVDLLVKTPIKKKFLIPKRRKPGKKILYKNNEESKFTDILFFPGCVLRDFYPEIIEKSLKFIENAGFTVALPENFSCCGFPHISQGWGKKFDKLKDKNKGIFRKYNFKYLIVPCGTGTLTFKKYYNLPDNIEIYEFTDFIRKFINDAKLKDEFRINKKITYHDPCHNVKSLKIEEQPRYFLQQAGDNFKDDRSKLCCGFGGLFSVGYPKTSQKILKRKKNAIKESGAETVITSCPGCYMQLRENIDEEVVFFSEIFRTNE